MLSFSSATGMKTVSKLIFLERVRVARQHTEHTRVVCEQQNGTVRMIAWAGCLSADLRLPLSSNVEIHLWTQQIDQRVCLVVMGVGRATHSRHDCCILRTQRSVSVSFE